MMRYFYIFSTNYHLKHTRIKHYFKKNPKHLHKSIKKCTFAVDKKSLTMTSHEKLKQLHNFTKIIQWFACIFLLSIPAIGCATLFPQPLSVASLKWIQFLQTTSIFLLPPLCMAYLWSERPLEWLRVKGER